MRWVGIDRGINGGLACLTASGEMYDVVPMPVLNGWVDGARLSDVFVCWTKEDRVRVIIEAVHSMPKQGVASTFKFGTNFGIVLGVIQCLDMSLERFTPQRWKKEFALGGKNKDASRAKATELWPSHRDHWRLKKQDGIAEAALIAEAGRRTL